MAQGLSGGAPGSETGPVAPERRRPRAVLLAQDPGLLHIRAPLLPCSPGAHMRAVLLSPLPSPVLASLCLTFPLELGLPSLQSPVLPLGSRAASQYTSGLTPLPAFHVHTPCTGLRTRRQSAHDALTEVG